MLPPAVGAKLDDAHWYVSWFGSQYKH